MRIDKLDRKIMWILLRAATTPKAEIGRLIGTAASAISERIRRLEESGVIRRFETRLDARQLGYGSLAYISITERKPTAEVNTGQLLAAVSGVEEVHKIAGRDCFLVKIRARDTEALGDILDNEINPIPTVAGTSTTIVLKTIKEDVALGGLTSLQENSVNYGSGIAAE
jgi:Lrp/AsnC family leucine-responsive transcriptional regulator